MLGKDFPVKRTSSTSSMEDGLLPEGIPLVPTPRSRSVAPVQIDFENISCTVPGASGGRRLILDRVSGSAKPGQILAIMGASGSGKSTLMNILCHRLELDNSPSESASGMKATGALFMNRHVANRELFRNYGVFVNQQDTLCRTMTPRESFQFAADLRLSKFATATDRLRRVQEVINELRMDKCADSMIGDPRHHGGLSGGERKRTAIGTELIGRPSVICLDEPTSGLDSFTALTLLELLKDMAKNHNRTIILNIHQPSNELFEHFDKLILLSRGEMLYYGPSSVVTTYFNDLGLHISRETNPADQFLRLIEHQVDELVDERSTHICKMQEESKDAGSPTQNRFDQNKTDKIISKSLEAARAHKYLSYGVTETLELPKLKTVLDEDHINIFREISVLGKRAMINYVRQFETTVVQGMQTIFLAILIGSLYYGIASNQAGITSRKGALFQLMMNNFMLSLNIVVACYPAERPLYEKEKANNMYSTWTYFWSKILVEFCFQSIWPIIYCSICYFMIGFQISLYHFTMFTLINVLVAALGMSIGLAMVSVVPDPNSAMALSPFIVIPLSVFVALFIDYEDIPWYFIWCYYISPFRYAYDMMLILEFSGLTLYCDTDELTTVGTSSYCAYSTGDEVLESLGIDAGDLYLDFFLSLGLYAAYLSLAYVCLSQRKERVK